MVYKFFNKKVKVSGIKSMSNQQLGNELLLENLKDEEFILLLKTMYGVLIYLICN